MQNEKSQLLQIVRSLSLSNWLTVIENDKEGARSRTYRLD